MIVKGIILIILIFGALVFLAVKMSESIVKAELKMFFFGLFFVTILTLFNIILSIYFVIKAKDKTGPRGRKGHKGIIGDPGNDGECNQNSCRKNSVHQMIINKLETSRDGTKNNLTENQMKKLCNLKDRLIISNNLEDLQKINSKTFDKRIFTHSFEQDQVDDQYGIILNSDGELDNIGNCN